MNQLQTIAHMIKRSREASAYAALFFLLLFAHSANAQSPTVKYITPDAGAAGMTVAVEIFGPSSDNANFGADGVYAPNTKVLLQNASDSASIILGPAIVSWDGRLVHVMLFIRENAAVGNIPLLVANGVNNSVPILFSIVTPQTFGTKNGGGQLAGGLGTRTLRGTMVVDSMILQNGTYTVNTNDLDASTSGDQAFLPLRILSKGPIQLNNATLSVRGSDASGNSGGNGGPGGGGGGGGMPSSGGSGYTGGGGVGESGGSSRTGGQGTGSAQGPAYYHGGMGLSGVTGGLGTEHNNSSAGNDEGGGGGTGHPFGSSGSTGLYGASSNIGGYGGGTGGGQGSGFPSYVTYGGGGGGYSSKGNQGGGNGDNGGHVHGNRLIAPLAGGSGGASGNIWYFFGGEAGNGGGGGGAVELSTFASFIMPQGTIDASGGNASNAVSNSTDHPSGGGGGSGGAIVISARDSISIGNAANSPTLNINGGNNGTGYNSGGAGGAGRIRLDGKVSSQNGNFNTGNYFTYARDYIGPVTSFVTTTKTDFTITGYGKGWAGNADFGNALTIYYRFPSTGWQTLNVSSAFGPGSRTARWVTNSIPRTTNPIDTVVYIAALQANPNALGADPFTREPTYLITHTSGLMGKIPGIPKIAVRETVIDFGKVRVGRCSSDTIVKILSQGNASLIVNPIQITGANAGEFHTTISNITISQFDSSTALKVGFCPLDTGCFSATLVINSNDTVKTITLLGCGIQPQIQSLADIDFGALKLDSCKDTTFTIANTGNDILTITKQTFGDIQFKYISPTLPITIQPGANKSITIGYCAADTMTHISADTVHSDARDSIKLITVRARGKVGVLSMPSILDFGTVAVGSCKDSDITISNTGSDSLFVTTAPTFAPEFTLAPGQLPIALAPGASKALTFRYCPSDTLPISSSDSIRTTAPVQGKPITLVGRGIRGILTSPQTIDFGCVPQGFTVDKTVLLKNVGPAAVTNVSATVSGSNDIVITRQPSSSVASGGNDSVTVHFIASTLGPISAKIVVSSSASTPVEIPITGKVSPPATLTILDTLLNFDTVAVGQSKTLCVRVLNPSCVALNLSTVSIAATTQGVFTIDPSSTPQILSDSVVGTLCLTFTPKTNAAEEGQVAFTTDSGIVRGVHLLGQGAASVVEVRPKILDFGDILVGTTSAPQTAFIINYGLLPAAISTPTIQGPNASEFSFTGSSRTLGFNDSISYDITISPGSVGQKTAYFVIPVGSGLDSVLLTGRGVQPGILVTRRTIDFGKVDVNPAPPPTQSFVIKNTGTAPLTVNNLVTTGDASFSIQYTPNTPSILASAGDSIIVTVTFNPSSIGVKNGQISVKNTSADEPIVDLLGEGVQAILTVSVDTVDFGDVFINTTKDSLQAIAVSNTGYGKALTIKSISITGPNNTEFAVQIPAPSTLQPNDPPRIYDAKFSPLAPGKREADLNIATDIVQALASTKSVHLIGNAVQRSIGVMLYSDTVQARPGQVIRVPVSTSQSLTPSGVTQLTVRVQFDPMLLDLRQAIPNTTVAPGLTASIKKYSIGDADITLTAPQAIGGPGKLFDLEMEVLLDGKASQSSIHLANATFGSSPTTLAQASDGLVQTQVCDTSEHVVVQHSITVAQNNPNPFNPRTTVRVEVLSAGVVKLTVYNALGEKVLAPYQESLGQGTYNLTIDASAIPSGSYYYVVEWNGSQGVPVHEVHSMTVVK